MEAIKEFLVIVNREVNFMRDIEAILGGQGFALKVVSTDNKEEDILINKCIEKVLESRQYIKEHENNMRVLLDNFSQKIKDTD